MKNILFFLSICGVLICQGVTAQNVAVTDDESYAVHSSAMLDVYSKTKGVLVPRLTTAEMNAITAPAAGLMVFNIDAGNFYFFSGSIWLPVSGVELFQTNGDTLYVTGNGMRMGVGDASPMSRLSVKGDPTASSDEPLFEVKNSTGDVIFAVYENEVKVNFKEGAKGVKGGFAVGGLSGTKGEPTEYLRITPDSVRIYINDPVGKGVKGGFAVGGLSGTKATKQNYFTVERDSARIYVDEVAKGVKGGFAVGGLSGTKSEAINFLDLTQENYFIGHRAGLNTASNGYLGTYNSFFGYEAGMNNTVGRNNVFIGFNAGHSNTQGANHVFIGNNAGFNYLGTEDGEENVFIGNDVAYNDSISTNSVYIGTRAGYNMKQGVSNVIIGDRAASSGNAQSENVFLGSSTGRDNNGSGNTMLGSYAGFTIDGSNNVLVGYMAGGHASGSDNVFIGYKAGDYENVSNQLIIGNSVTPKLIWGDFSTGIVAFNGRVGIGTVLPNASASLDVNGNFYASGGDVYTSASNGVINAGGGIMNFNVNVISDGVVNNNFATGDEDLYINGDLEVDGNTYKIGGGTFLTQSDKRLKKDIRPYQDGLSKILKINPVYFKYNELSGKVTEKEYIGVVAQDVKDVVPYAVELTPFKRTEIEDQNGNVTDVKWDGTSYYTFDPSSLTYLLINAVKEQQQIIDEQTKRIDTLENQNKEIVRISRELERLQNLINSK